MKIISSKNKCGFFSYTFKKNTSNNATLTLQEVGGYLNPSYFVDGIRTSHNFALAITKLMISTPKVFLLAALSPQAFLSE